MKKSVKKSTKKKVEKKIPKKHLKEDMKTQKYIKMEAEDIEHAVEKLQARDKSAMKSKGRKKK
jgi:hypothetical protein